MRKAAFLLFAILTSVTLAIPSARFAFAENAPMLLPVDAAPLTVRRDGEEIARFSVEIADERIERSRGLMFRREFPDDRAMLFVFEATREVAFWMQNTPRSLDMLFVREDGELASIARDTTPFSTDEVPSGEPVRYVVEINAGLSDRLGIEPGDHIVHPVIGTGVQ